MSSERYNPRGSPERKRSASPRAARPRRRSRSRSRSRSALKGDYMVVKVRGLPYDCKPSEVIKFLDDCRIVGGDDGVFFPTNDKGMVTGEAFVALEGAKDQERALERHKQTLGERYVEVFESRKAVMERAMRSDGRPEQDLKREVLRARGLDRGRSRERGARGARSRSRTRSRGRRGRSQSRDRGRHGGSYCVKLRGLPWETKKDDVKDFLGRVRYKAIVVCEDERGRASGEAWVQLDSKEELERALDLHKKTLGSRYVEVFEANSGDMDKLKDREGGGRGGGRSKARHVVKLHGLPYRSSEREISHWLGEAADPTEVVIEMDRDGRPSGDARAYFASSREARRAAEKMHKRDLGSRYVECYYEDEDRY